MKTIKIYVDDLRPTPPGYLRCHRAKEAMLLIESLTKLGNALEISLDHDAGDYRAAGGDYINILNWLEYRQHSQNGKIYPIRIHSMNAVGYANMWAAVFADVGVAVIAILNSMRVMKMK